MLTKSCTSCKVVMALSAFGPTVQTKDGRRHACRLCQNLARKDYYQKHKEKYQEAARFIRKRDRAVISQRRKAAYKKKMDSLTKEDHAIQCVRQRVRSRKSYHSNPQRGRAIAAKSRSKLKDHCRARWAVKFAIRCGKMKRAPCKDCGSTIKVHAHHHNGYSKEHWLDVEWLCSLCHGRRHRAEV